MTGIRARHAGCGWPLERVLDAPEREAYLPMVQLIDRLELRRTETVLDCGAGTGRLVRAVADQLTPDGQLIAVDESPAMFERLRFQPSEVPRRRGTSASQVPLPDGPVYRVLAPSGMLGWSRAGLPLTSPADKGART